MNRIEMLREMGITPVWVPRLAKPVPSKREMALPPEALVDAGVGDVAAKTGSGSASQRVPLAKMPPAPTAMPRTVAAVDPARAERIARMDWPALKDAVTSCQACALCTSRHSTVFGSGDESADLMIIGEAPGQEEDREGEPFVGQAGKLLDSMLAALDLTRTNNVYMAQCAPHLVRQVELLAPKLILLMGRFAVQSILETDASIAALRGKRHAWRGVPVVVTYHPAYLLRTLPDKAKAWEDLVFARSVLTEVVTG